MFGPLVIPGFATEASASSITSGNIVALTNSEREANSLVTLTNDPRLAAAAQAKAQDMLSKDYWDHFGPNGETPWQFISGAGYSYIYAGENLAKGFSTAEGVHQAWMASPTHRANIVNPNYRDIGVAVVQGVLSGESVTLVVQMFGATSTAPAPTTATTTPTPAPAPTPKPSQPLPAEEKGEIKSISIERPSPDEVITDPAVDLEGSVEGYESNLGTYTVLVKRDNEDLGSAKAAADNWKFDKGSDWEEGENNITVLLKDNAGIQDSIVLNVDSRAPEVDDDKISILLDGNHAEVNVTLAEIDAEVYISMGGETYAFAHQGEGIYTAFIPENLVTQPSVQGVLIVSDPNGNSQELDVSEIMASATRTDNLAPVSNPTLIERVLSGFTSMSIKGKVNLGFGIFLFLLLGSQVVMFISKKKLKEKGGYLMTAGIFFFVVIVGLFTEVSGNIN